MKILQQDIHHLIAPRLPLSLVSFSAGFCGTSLNKKKKKKKNKKIIFNKKFMPYYVVLSTSSTILSPQMNECHEWLPAVLVVTY